MKSGARIGDSASCGAKTGSQLNGYQISCTETVSKLMRLASRGIDRAERNLDVRNKGRRSKEYKGKQESRSKNAISGRPSVQSMCAL